MTLIVNRAGTKLRIGDRWFKLWPVEGSDGTRLCESDPPAAFTMIRHLRVADFPPNLELVIDPDTRKYSHPSFLSITRWKERLRFTIVCDYLYSQWTALVNLRNFIGCFVKQLNKLPWLKAHSVDDPFDDEGLGFEVNVEVGMSGSLGDHYQRIIDTLIATHAQVLNRLSDSVRATVLADISPSAAVDFKPSIRTKPLAFICHDSRDKRRVARPIAQRLAALNCPVWYDEFSLCVGDRLRESIEKGLKQVGKCILIVSPHFLSNAGWSRAEFDSIFAREIIQGKDILLPVWVGVTPRQVSAYSHALVNRVGVNWRIGIDEVVGQLYAATMRGVRARRHRL